MEIFLFLYSRKTFLWFNWNFLLMEFCWVNNFLFLKNWLVTFSSCLSSTSFAIKVKCFVLQYHFTSFPLIDFWCFVRGVLLFWHCIITNMFDIFRLMLFIFAHESPTISTLFVCRLWCSLFLSSFVHTAQYWMTLTFHKSLATLLLLMNNSFIWFAICHSSWVIFSKFLIWCLFSRGFLMCSF